MTFKDLKFEPHPLAPLFDKQATHNFPNGYRISVINGHYARCDVNTYEVAIMKDGFCCYTTPLTNDVLGYQTPDDIDKILKEIETYKENEF